MKRLLLVLYAYGCLGSTQAADLSAYYNDAKSFGGTFNPGIMSTAKDATAAPTILPMYGTTSPEAALMGDGKMSVATPSTVKVTDCEFNPADPDAYKRQECEAINFWRKNPSVRPQYTISRSTDPIVTKVNTIKADPQAVTGTMPTMTGSYSGCQTITTGGVPITEIESCEETAIIESKTCERTREVEVDADFDYECNTSQKKIDYPACNKILIVNVELKSCSPGDILYQSGNRILSTAGDETGSISIVCGNVPTEFIIRTEFPTRCTGGYSGYWGGTFNARVSAEETPQILSYGTKIYWPKHAKYDSDGWTPVLWCWYQHPNELCEPDYGNGIAGRIRLMENSKTLYANYSIRRSCALELQSASCNLTTKKCSFSFWWVNEWHGRGHVFPDTDLKMTVSDINMPEHYVITDTWDNQCVTLESRE